MSVFYGWRKRLAGFWQHFLKNRGAVYCVPILFFFILLAIFGPYISPYNFLRIGKAPPMQPPSLEYPMGTDDLGRDILSGVLSGTRVSLTIGILASVTATIVGLLIGSIAGFYGGVIDNVLMRLTEVFLVIPKFVFALLLVAFVGPSVWNLILVIGLLSWPRTARLVRGEFLSLREREFVLAARAIGVPNRSLIFGEILPNAITVVIPNAMMEVSSAILIESGISFLGLGDPNIPSWGFILNNAMRILRSAWWVSVFPGLAISTISLSLNLIGDGLNDALNPKTY